MNNRILPACLEVKNMDAIKMKEFIQNVVKNLPADWLNLTTHRLDIYNESLAKKQFLDEFENLFNNNNTQQTSLNNLPTAFDYIRLGHPLSCVLEWFIAKTHNLKAENVISFSSRTAPILAVLRKNLLSNTTTQIVYTDELPNAFNLDLVKRVYGYNFSVQKVGSIDDIPAFEGSTIFVSQKDRIGDFKLSPNIDFYVNSHKQLGSVVAVNGAANESYISEIQHVRRRETIAMTPANCLIALKMLADTAYNEQSRNASSAKSQVLSSIETITHSHTRALVGSSGLSVQYAIVMGLIHHAIEEHPGKAIKVIVPPNCYGGTNDQARRVAACLANVEVLDLPVDGGNDMVNGVDQVLDTVAEQDAIPYIIAEIPTNPRVEVPDLEKLQEALSKKRTTPAGEVAVEPVFILDQTFCPNVQFLGEEDYLSGVSTISYVSGSKFPSGGKCTAGYCVADEKAAPLLEYIEKHLQLCDNVATDFQFEVLAEQMPSMNQRIQEAYQNTREFVSFIEEVLPTAKINFVSEELAKEGFTPSVFSLDLPTKGNTEEERESYKRALNHKLIDLMITEIPYEGKHCVSYGQLKGSYWTIPATSTQGTTKEGDKDYIARVSLAPDMDLEKHKEVFHSFVKQIL